MATCQAASAVLPSTVHKSLIFLMPASSGKKLKSRLTLNHPHMLAYKLKRCPLERPREKMEKPVTVAS
jgi:hypothetical protein